jgi:LPS-assembly protein
MARRVTTVLLCVSACCAFAQDQSTNPLDPSGFPPNQPKDTRLPPPMRQEQGSYELKLISSEEWSVEGDEVMGKKVEFEYRGYRVRADEALGDLKTNQFALRGNVNVLGEDYVVRGDYVFVDFRARSFKFVQGDVDLKQSLLMGRVQTDVYVRAAEALGTEQKIDGHQVTVTTCEYPDPHYAIYSGDVTVEPGKRLTFRDFRLKVLGSTIVRIPKVVIPLDRRTQGITPDAGHSEDEGYFLKTKIGFPVRSDTFYTRVDLMTKKGVGLGGEYVFESGRGRGGVRAYGNFLGNNPGFTASGDYKVDLNWAEIEASQSYRRFFFLTGIDSTVMQSRLRISPRIRGGRTDVTYFRDNTVNGSFSSTNSNVQFSDRRTWSPGLTSSIELNYTDTIARNTEGKGILSKREALEVRAHMNYDLKRLVARLDYQRIIPITESFNFIGGIDRTPELTLMTDSNRLYGESRPKWMPNFSLLASAGIYNDRFNSLQVNRYFLDLRTNRIGNLQKLWSLTYDAGFRQGVYSDGTAQYTPSINVQLRYNAGSRLSGNIYYGYLRQYGYSPIQSDRSGTTNFLSLDAVAEIAKYLTAAAQVGFDFHQQSQGFEGWVSPGVKLEYIRIPDFKARITGNYIPQLSSIGNLRFDMAWQRGETFYGVGLRYDGVRDSWANLNLFIDALKVGRLKISALLLYNGYRSRFDSKHFALTYDLHCAEAVLQVLENSTGFRPGREIVFFIRIKGLPFDTPFGIGRQGQPLDYGTGGGWR